VEELVVAGRIVVVPEAIEPVVEAMHHSALMFEGLIVVQPI